MEKQFKPRKVWAVGDIHGSHTELMALMGKLKDAGLDCERDTVVFMGDYIDRGPDAKKVIEQLLDYHRRYEHWVFLYGNHEDIFYDFIVTQGRRYGISIWFANGGKTTWESYGGHFGKQDRPDGPVEMPKTPEFPKEHLDFLFKETHRLYEMDKDYVFVHAGLVPGASIEESSHYPDTILWAREGFIDSDWDWGKFVIFGHSAAYKSRWGELGMPIMMKNKCGIDGAVCPPANKNLLAIELPEKKIHGIKAGSLEYFTLDYDIIK